MLLKYSILVLFIILACLNFSCDRKPKDGKVFICSGLNSLKYHNSKECKGINACGGSIELVSVNFAKEIGRTPCRFCYHTKYNDINVFIDSDEVYVCTGNNASKYHSNKFCEGLNACRDSIIYVDFKEAETEGLTPCAICFYIKQ
jgi:hypothetical protein